MSMRDAIAEGACGFEATGTVAGGTGRRRGFPPTMANQAEWTAD